MSMIRLLILPWSRFTPMFGLIVVLSLIRLLVFPTQVLVSLLIMLPLFGMSDAGDRLIFFTVLIISRLVGVSTPLFLCLFSLFRELKCGESILALQSSGAVHLGVDNLGVVRHVGRLLDGRPGRLLFELVKDGDLLLLINRMLHLRGPDTVRISKV